MRSFALGSLAAAVVMFVLGFIFFAALGGMLYDPLAEETAAAVQAALGNTLPATGTYMVPAGSDILNDGRRAAHEGFLAGGVPAFPMELVMGFVHFLLTALLIGYALTSVGGDFGRQARVVFWFALAASAFMRLGEPMWLGASWRPALYVFVADAVIIIAGGLVLARWFTSRGSPVAA